MEHITILGSGGFGLSLALSAYRSGHAVKVWSKFPEELEAIRRDGEHKQKLPDVPIPQEISLVADLETAIADAITAPAARLKNDILIYFPPFQTCTSICFITQRSKILIFPSPVSSPASLSVRFSRPWRYF